MRVLITGASGLLGRELMAAFRSGNDLLGLSHRRAGEGLIQTDLRDKDAFKEMLRDFRPEIVIHCAAYRDPDYCEMNREDALKLNVEPVQLLCSELDAEVGIALISSDYLFDGLNPPYSEESERNPVNFYGETKCMAENLVVGRKKGLSLRIPVLIGRDDEFEKSGFVYKLVSSVLEREPTVLDDIHVRFPTWTRDVGRALRFAVDRDIAGLLNFSGLEGGTQYRLAVKTAAILGKPADHIAPAGQKVPRTAARPIDSQLSVSKIKSLGFDRFTPFAEALEAIVGNEV